MKALAFDFGASSGRAILGERTTSGVSMAEICRFQNVPLAADGALRWDFPKQVDFLYEGLNAAGDAESVGIDTWGVDFGLLGADGKLLELPVHYRDPRTDGLMEEVWAIIPREELYARTGIQMLPFNTIYQLYYLATRKRELLEAASAMLLMPDLMVYRLTGRIAAEHTIASTTQLVDIRTGDWAWDIMDELKIPRRLFPEIVPAGTPAGRLAPAVQTITGCRDIPVCYIAGHDTGAAFYAASRDRVSDGAAKPDPMEWVPQGGMAVLSSGTWSLLGTVSGIPIATPEAARLNFTNEGGWGGTFRILKNIAGLWPIQECARIWRENDPGLTFDTLEREARETPPTGLAIHIDDARFIQPGDMPSRVEAYLRESGQPPAGSRGRTTRALYENLAAKYRDTLRDLSSLTGVAYDTVKIVGGGVKDTLLCELTAGVCGVAVEKGPSEATALGNLLGQFEALGRESVHLLPPG
jgi:sugar (pentulose or hexulose) kinase